MLNVYLFDLYTRHKISILTRQIFIIKIFIGKSTTISTNSVSLVETHTETQDIFADLLRLEFECLYCRTIATLLIVLQSQYHVFLNDNVFNLSLVNK